MKSERQHTGSAGHGLPPEPLNLNKPMPSSDVTGNPSSHQRSSGRPENSWERQFTHQQVLHITACRVSVKPSTLSLIIRGNIYLLHMAVRSCIIKTGDAFMPHMQFHVATAFCDEDMKGVQHLQLAYTVL